MHRASRPEADAAGGLAAFAEPEERGKVAEAGGGEEPFAGGIGGAGGDHSGFAGGRDWEAGSTAVYGAV